MDKNKYELLEEVLKRLDANGLLSHLVIVGSWCVFLYRDYFRDQSYISSIRTRDLDFLIPLPIKIGKKVDFYTIIEDLGFIEVFKGDAGYTIFEHPELIIEFLVEEKGSGISRPIYIDEIGVRPQSLRYLNILNSNVIKLRFRGIDVFVPHPINFAFHKILVSTKRKKNYKKEMDKRQALQLLNYLVQKGEKEKIISFFNRIPTGWQKTIKKELKTSDEKELLEIIED